MHKQSFEVAIYYFGTQTVGWIDMSDIFFGSGLF